MVAADSPYAFLRTLHPHDQVTYWIGAIMREGAQLEMTCMLMLRAVLHSDHAQLAKLNRDLTLGQVIRRIGLLMEEEQIREAAPDLAEEILTWTQHDLDGIDKRRNRVAHDVVSGDGTGRGAVRYGSAEVFSRGPREQVTERMLISLYEELLELTKTAEDLWSRAERAWGA